MITPPSGGDPPLRHSRRLQIFDKHFLQFVSISRTVKKFKEAGSERRRDHQLRRGALGIHRAEPAAKGRPDEVPTVDREMLKEPLCDTGQLDVPMIGRQLPPHGLTIRRGLPMEILIAGFPCEGCHPHHPKVTCRGPQGRTIGIRAEGMDRLLEAQLNFEAERG